MGPMPTRRLLAAVAVVLAAPGLAACTGHGAVSQDVKGSVGYQIGDAALDWIGPADRHHVNGVSGTLLDGGHFDLAQWKGKVVVVNFWGEWCAPCNAEATSLQQVFQDDQGKGVEFLGIDIRDNRASALAFERRYAVTYPSLFDPDNTLALQFRGVPPNATPTTIVLDRMGRIAARQSGQILYTQLRAVVARVLAEPV
jgi:thiol-disulfide isomerase/thioredoxin